MLETATVLTQGDEAYPGHQGQGKPSLWFGLAWGRSREAGLVGDWLLQSGGRQGKVTQGLPFVVN